MVHRRRLAIGTCDEAPGHATAVRRLNANR
jgi:hypothetical protein